MLPLGRLRLRPVISWMNAHTYLVSRYLPVPLDSSLKELLLVWTDESFLRTLVPMSLPLPSLQLMTDASRLGWGGVLIPHSVSGTSCIRHQGTLRSPALMNLSKTLLEFCFAHSVSLVPKHLSGALNVLADQGSRSTEWSLDVETFAWVASNFGPLQVDPPIAEASSHP